MSDTSPPTDPHVVLSREKILRAADEIAMADDRRLPADSTAGVRRLPSDSTAGVRRLPSGSMAEGTELPSGSTQSRAPRILSAAAVHIESNVTSTQDVALQLAADGAAHGTVVVADYQSVGRGRNRRAWIAPPGTAALFSVILRPRLGADYFPQLSMAAALAVADELSDVLNDVDCDVTLKWPNDIRVAKARIGVEGNLAADPAAALPDPADLSEHHRPPGTLDQRVRLKIAGILAETITMSATKAVATPLEVQPAVRDNGTAVVIGVGINLFQTTEQLPPGATSVAVLAADEPAARREALRARGTRSPSVDRSQIVGGAVERLLQWCRRIEAGESPHPAWRDRLDTLGRQVTVASGNTSLQGTALDARPDGGLVIRTADGLEHVVYAGDVNGEERSDGS